MQVNLEKKVDILMIKLKIRQLIQVLEDMVEQVS